MEGNGNRIFPFSFAFPFARGKIRLACKTSEVEHKDSGNSDSNLRRMDKMPAPNCPRSMHSVHFYLRDRDNPSNLQDN